RADAPAAEGVKWESDGRGEYSLDTVELPERGTTVVLHLKPDEDEFLADWTLRSLIGKYSDHVAFPIRMPADTPAPADDSETDAPA
ncbi:molecular chaperone HtpG, partial [Pantoea sp. SIMBA_079]